MTVATPFANNHLVRAAQEQGRSECAALRRARACSFSLWLVLGLASLGEASALPVFLADRTGTAPVTEVLGRDTRPVLFGYPRAPLAMTAGVAVGADGGVEISAPAHLVGDRKALVATSLIAAGQVRVRPAPQVASVGEDGSVVVEFPTSKFGPGTSVKVAAWRYDLPDPRTSIVIDDVAIPQGARLRFSPAFADVGRTFAGATFRVAVRPEGGAWAGVFDESLKPTDPDGGTWTKREVGLEAFAGQNVSLRFETELAEGEEGRPTYPLWGDPTIVVPTEADARKPSIIVVSVDTLAAGHLGSYGYARDTAPFLDSEIVGKGTLFERAFAAANTTGPSHMTAFTGLRPSSHGLVGNLLFQAMAPGVTTLAERLRSAGFVTGAKTEVGPLAAARGFGRGFSSYVEIGSYADKGSPGTADETLREALDWIRQHRNERFFLFIHTFEVHTPYVPPSSLDPLFSERLPGEAEVPERFDPARYDREIRHFDALFQSFYAALQKLDVWETTILVVLSDHGEAFGEHDFMHHGGVLYDEVLHVPLVFHGAGIPTGRKVGSPVGLIDLTPTLLELVDIEPGPGFEGRSLQPWLREALPEVESPPRVLVAESWEKAAKRLEEGKLRQAAMEPPSLAVRRGGKKLIRERRDGKTIHHFFDVEQDPRETKDLYRDDDPTVIELRSILDSYERKKEEPKSTPAKISIEPERRDRLKALGYVD